MTTLGKVVGCLSALAVMALTGCDDTRVVPPAPNVVDPNSFLPFDVNDPNAVYPATLRVEARDGSHPPASITYGGTTYTTDANGVLTIPAVRYADPKGFRVVSSGYLPRSVRLDYQSVSGAGLRVVLEQAGLTREFSSRDGSNIAQGPMEVVFAANTFANADGTPYDGVVKVAALGTDPLVSVIEMGPNGLRMRRDFDPGRIPQGFGIATDANDVVHFLLPESLFQVELSDASGNSLQLREGATARVKFKHSMMTQHTEGEILPMYVFDVELARWVEGGKCTVEKATDGSLSCVGDAPHFSTWSVASGEDEDQPACGNFQFRILADPEFYDAAGNLAQTALTVTGFPESSFDKANSSSSPEHAVAGSAMTLTSSAGACIYAGFPTLDLHVSTTLTSSKTGATRFDRTFSAVHATSSSEVNSHNVVLLTGAAMNGADLKTIDADCRGCPTTIIDIDLRSAAPGGMMSCAPCSGDGTLNAETCGCGCPMGKMYVDGTGCVMQPCDAGKEFDAIAGACVAINACKTNNGGCPINADCATNPTTFMANCTCKIGYEPDHDDGNTCMRTPCNPDPCQHGGTCISHSADSFSCDCAGTGYSGTTCDMDVNECLTNNGGCAAVPTATCTNMPGSRICACATGYGGDGITCTDINACTNNPCLTGEVCADLAPPALDNAAGRTCTNIDACINNPCLTGETCADLAPPALDNAAGRTCTNIDACINNPCLTGETCTDLAPPALDNAAGRTCTDINACINNPCLMGETCTDLPPPALDDAAGRTCAPGDPCTPNPCLNGGACTPAGPLPACMCFSGYTGEFCEIPPMGVTADLTSGTTGNLVTGQPFLRSLGADVTFQGGFGAMITGVRITGLIGQTDILARLYDAGGNQVALGQNFTISGSTADITFTMGYMPFPSEQLRVVVLPVDGSDLELFEPTAFGYTETSNNFLINGGYEGLLDFHPTTPSNYIPQITVLF